MALALLLHGSGAAAQRVTVDGASSPIYWGAYIEGTQTYSYLYGGEWRNAPWASATWNAFEAHAGKRVSIEHYGQPPPWEHAFDRVPAGLVVRRGAIPAIDIATGDVPLRAIASGAYDRPIEAWAEQARAWGHPFFLLLDVEMNGGWEAYAPGVNGNNAGDFVDAWRHMHDLFAAAGAANVTWVWCPNIEFDGSAPYSQLYPGDRYVDWTCLDGYNDGDASTSFARLFGRSYRDLSKLAPTKPIMIGEVASAEFGSGVKASWITRALSVQLPRQFPRIKALLWFNWRIFERGVWRNWEIESSPSAQAAFAAAIRAPYYVSGGGFRHLPLLSKIHPFSSSVSR